MNVIAISEYKIKSISSMISVMGDDLKFLYEQKYLEVSKELLDGATKEVEANALLFKTSADEIISCSVLVNAFEVDLQTALYYFKYNRATEHLHSLWMDSNKKSIAY